MGRQAMRRWLGVLVMGLALALGAGCESSSGGDDTAGGGADTVAGDDTATGTDTAAGTDTVTSADTVAGDDTATGEDTAAPEPTEIGKFATFNAGLAYDYVLFATERQPEIGPAIAGFEADVVCLQEVWRVEDVQAVLGATATAYPHQYWYDATALPNEGAGPACEAGPATTFRTCVENAGCDVDPRGLATCAQEECQAEFLALSPDCLQCLVANLSKPLDEIFQACAEGSTLYLYDGSLGTVLLSKWAFTETSETILDSTFNRRGVIYGRVAAPSGESFAVFCTHTTPEFDGITYPGDYESWDGEQERQIGQMLTFVDEKKQDGDVVVLLGDMNDGPAIPPDIEGELEDNFQMFLDAGFVDPYPQSVDVQCTFCAANELNPSDTRNAVIDHTFFRGLAAGYSLAADRVLDGAVVTVTPAEGEKQVPLSDHYGVRATLLKAAE